jgi:hypothetical protein
MILDPYAVVPLERILDIEPIPYIGDGSMSIKMHYSIIDTIGLHRKFRITMPEWIQNGLNPIIYNTINSYEA